MSTRERWIVYPLLFLTLGITMRLALHDKIIPPTRLQIEEIVAGQIHCNKLQADQGVMAGQVGCNQLQTDLAVCNRLRSPGGIVTGNVQCGELQVIKANGQPTVLVGTDARTKGGLITTLSPTGTPLVLLQPTDSGGLVVAEYISSTFVPRERLKTLLTPSPKEPQKGPPSAGP